jgi:hypothetical protein
MIFSREGYCEEGRKHNTAVYRAGDFYGLTINAGLSESIDKLARILDKLESKEPDIGEISKQMHEELNG